jgi:hypothetical protein
MPLKLKRSGRSVIQFAASRCRVSASAGPHQDPRLRASCRKLGDPPVKRCSPASSLARDSV